MRMIGVDVGGTFTDVVFCDTTNGRVLVHKLPTTPDDPSRGVLDGIRGLCDAHAITLQDIAHVFHGTTVATNAVLEHKGARAGMITNKGFRDILHIARHQRPEHYSIRQEVPWQDRPLVRRRHRKVVTGRILPPRGEVLDPLDEDEVRDAARALRQEGVEAVAICFLFAYIDATHEERARAIVEEVFPEAYVTTSAAVSPQFREFERFTTTALNAFVGPRIRGYVNRIDDDFRAAGMTSELHIMTSNGGVATPAMVGDKPVLTLLSGPAAGVLGGAWSGALSGRDSVITFDVGGTSADIGIVREGAYAEASARDTWIAGFPLLVPMIDIHTIGAGGGSIAHIDTGGAFRVGPGSAGAAPGPAAYGHGVEAPTVTDANVVLGRLDVDGFLGGGMRLDRPAAETAIARLATELGLEPLEAAAGVLTIINANMANAIRSRTVQKGLDPRDFALVAFGGAGPQHGAEVASLLDIPEVIVPPYPGLTSATGLLTTDLKYEAIKTEFQVQGSVDLDRLNGDLAALRDSLEARFRDDGLTEDRVEFAPAGDLRYVGQGYELRVAVPHGAIDEAGLAAVWEAFHAMHEAEYGHRFPDNPIEIVNVRVTGVGEMPKIGPPPAPAGGSINDARLRASACAFRVNGGIENLETTFYLREALPIDHEIEGPAIVLQTDSTIVLPPGASGRVTAEGNFIIRVGGGHA